MDFRIVNDHFLLSGPLEEGEFSLRSYHVAPPKTSCAIYKGDNKSNTGEIL